MGIVMIKSEEADISNDMCFIDEMHLLRKKVAELKHENRKLVELEQDRKRLEHFLKERNKELNCLYGIAKEIERSGSSLDILLQGIVELLPDSWQYPEITAGRIVFDSHEYTTPNFVRSQWRQISTINIDEKEVGAVEVYYMKEMPAIDEGPFLQEERSLIDMIAERIGRVAERIRTQKQLEVEQNVIKNMNITLREILAKVQEEKKEIGEMVQANVDKVIIPILHALDSEVSPGQKGYVALLKQNLAEITSPFTDKLSKRFMSLSPAEIQICNMIKMGMSSKEIAHIRHLSPATVHRHREHIRRKLGLTNQSVNLTTYLNTFNLHGQEDS